MSLSPVFRFLLLPAIPLSLLLPSGLTAQQAKPLGEWRFDPAHSDSLHARSGQERGPGGSSAGRPPQEPPGSEPREPGTGGYGGGWHGSPRGPDDKARARLRQTFALLRHLPRTIRIDADSFTATDDSGVTTAWPINGNKHKQPLEGGGELETSVRWKGDAVQIAHKVDGGGKLTETYELGLGGSRMLAFIELTGPMQTLSFTRQYQLSDATAAPLGVPPASPGAPGDTQPAPQPSP